MARDLNPVETILASPRQASIIFNPDGAHPIRQKHLFLVRFLRQTNVSSDWKDSMTFVVKQMDRPSVEATTETINQYNKKRVIHTGVKYNPVNITFYDTADGAAQNLWLEYSKYYYADYTQEISAFADDILNNVMNDNSGEGYGYRFRADAAAMGIGSQNFFDGIEVMQLWANEYVSYRLVNPKITSFTPDDFDYSSSDASTIAMNITYEAISHQNSGRPQDVLSNEVLTSVFNREFSGDMPEFPTAIAQTFVSPEDEVANGTQYSAGELLNIDTNSEDPVTIRDNTDSSMGVLARFGTYDFGSETITSTMGDTTVERTFDTTGLNEADRQSLINAVQAMNAQTLAETLTPGIATGVNTAAKKAGNSPIDQYDRSNGITLSDQAVGQYNLVSDGTFLIGNRKSLNII